MAGNCGQSCLSLSIARTLPPARAIASGTSAAFELRAVKCGLATQSGIRAFTVLAGSLSGWICFGSTSRAQGLVTGLACTPFMTNECRLLVEGLFALDIGKPLAATKES
jgi:hypothetical protein